MSIHSSRDKLLLKTMIKLTEIESRPHNIGFAIWRVKCYYETFVQDSTSVILLNFCAKMPPHRKAVNRCMPALLDLKAPFSYFSLRIAGPRSAREFNIPNSIQHLRCRIQHLQKAGMQHGFGKMLADGGSFPSSGSLVSCWRREV